MSDRFGGKLEEVSDLGVTTWSLGEFEWRAETQPHDALVSSLEYSMNFLDASPLYAGGRSEEIVGEFLTRKDARESFFLASKGGLISSGKGTYRIVEGYDVLREELEASLERLGTDQLDLYLLYGVEGLLPEPAGSWLHKVREDGFARYVGVLQLPDIPVPRDLQTELDVLVRPGSVLDDLADGDGSTVESARTVGYDPFFGGLFDQQYAEVDSEVLDYEVRRHHPKFSSDRVEYLSALKTLAREFREQRGQNLRLEPLILAWLLDFNRDDHLLIGARSADEVHLASEARRVELTGEDRDLIESTLRDVYERKGRPEFLNPPPVLPRHSFDRHVLPLRLGI